MRGITGEELGQGLHIHYISSAFGNNILREFVFSELRKGRYDLPAMLHIEFDREVPIPIINAIPFGNFNSLESSTVVELQ